MISKKEKGISLLEEILTDMEKSKVSVLSCINKLNRAAKLLGEKNIVIWTEIQLGNHFYVLTIKEWIDAFLDNQRIKSEESEKKLEKIQKSLAEIGITIGETIGSEEINAKASESGGGFNNIGFIEEKYADFSKHKKGNDGTYYQSNLVNTISIIKSLAYKKTSFLHSKYAFEGLPQSNFELLKNNVEDVLFDLDPELAEMLMLAFKAVSSDNQEEWSQALTTCRRFIEKLADKLYPASDKTINGRSLAQENYINRIWAFMDDSIKSESNKDLAKKHIDLLGQYLQSGFRLSNKGVHTKLTRIEALKSVLHIYMACADLLGFLDIKAFQNKNPSLISATIDEIEAFGGVTREIAKEIIKLRVKHGKLTKELISKIPGVGEKTLNKLLKNMTLEELN
jgi:DNA uptake protein ComE-like DNA-binding protein